MSKAFCFAAESELFFFEDFTGSLISLTWWKSNRYS